MTALQCPECLRSTPCPKCAPVKCLQPHVCHGPNCWVCDPDEPETCHGDDSYQFHEGDRPCRLCGGWLSDHEDKDER